MASKQTFNEWLKKQSMRDDPVGDLAKDAQYDSSVPSGNASIEDWQLHLENRRACDDAMRTLEEAWEEYAPSHRELA